MQKPERTLEEKYGPKLEFTVLMVMLITMTTVVIETSPWWMCSLRVLF